MMLYYVFGNVILRLATILARTLLYLSKGGNSMARNKLAGLVKLIDVQLNNTEPEKSFLTDLRRSIEITNSKEYRKGSPSYKPSGMGCIRQMYYVRTGTDPDNMDSTHQLIGICNNGTDTHVRIQTYISKMRENGMDCDYVDVAKFVQAREIPDIEIISQNGMETKLYHKTLNLSFLCDGIIRYRGVYYILELKTEGSNKFWMRQGVDPSHYHQASCYSLALQLDQVIFVYINRDTYDMKSYLFDVTSDMKQEIVGLITNCEDYVQENKVPPKPMDVTSKTCSYCKYRERCARE